MESVVVSVRIKSTVKKTLEKEGIDVQSEIKDFLDQRASQIELKEAISRMKKIIEARVKPSKRGFAVKSIREDRDEAH